MPRGSGDLDALRERAEKEFSKNLTRYISEWSDFLRFPSISADPAYENGCRDCAEWLASHLGSVGFASRLIETPSKPLVFASHKGPRGAPTVLFYGHYDVQPADPLDRWITPPFSPQLRDGRLYARGAQDNKGQVMYALKAMQSLIENDLLRFTIKVLIEGEEESGSSGIKSALPKISDRLGADILMSCDTDTVDSNRATITMGLRGMIYLTVALSGPLRDLHSGVHGGRAPNPATEMARLVASLHNPDGSIAVEGFYEGVPDPTDEERELAHHTRFSAALYRRQTGVPPVAGESGYTPPERVGFRPSIDVNGIHAGYAGPGSKTIIPARSEAKLSARLVRGQNPERCLKAILEHLKRRAPRGLRLGIAESGIGGEAVRLDVRSPLVRQAGQILSELTGRPPAFQWNGASIPVIPLLARESGGEPLLVGFGMEEDNAHAPNESFSLRQFRNGYMYAAAFLGMRWEKK